MERRRRMAEKRVNVDVPKNSIQNTVGIVVRIHEGRHSSKEIKKELKEFGLNKKYDAIFMKLDSDNIRKLKPLDAYVAYGYISQQLVEQLLQRRAYTKAETNKKHTLSDNLTIEKLLGEYNILCVNDLVHEIYNIGINFDIAKSLLCTFQLAAPVGGYEKKILHIHHEVEEKGGFIGNNMEEFITKII